MKIKRILLPLFLFLLAPLAGQNSSFRGWVKGEYLLWEMKKNPLPAPLVTKGSF